MSPKEKSVTDSGKEYNGHLTFFYILISIYSLCKVMNFTTFSLKNVVYFDHIYPSSSSSPVLPPSIASLPIHQISILFSHVHMCVCDVCMCKSRFHIQEKTCYLSFWQISLNRMLSVWNHIPANDMILLLMADYNSTVNRLYLLYPFTHSYMLQLDPYCKR